MSQETSRQTIPDEWAAKARCPVCGGAPLKVRRQPPLVDQMVCNRCHSSFELEEGTGRLWFTAIAPALTGMLENRWVTILEVGEAVHALMARRASRTHPPVHRAQEPQPPVRRVTLAPGVLPHTGDQPPEEMALNHTILVPDTERITEVFAAVEKEPPKPIDEVQPDDQKESSLDQIIPAAVEPPPEATLQIPPTPAPIPGSEASPHKPAHLTPEELTRRARELHALGNSPTQIREILGLSTDASQADIQAAVRDMQQQENDRRGSQGRTFRWMALGAVALFIILVLVGLALRTALPEQPADGLKLPEISIQSTLAPETGKALVIPTPAVLTGPGTGVIASACPKNPEGAAALFGGLVANWSSSDKINWFMFSEKPFAVRVPENMTATLVTGTAESMGPMIINGPATVKNAVSISIACR